jgi:ribonuclease Z
MAKLTVLGSANAVADEQHENTHLVLQGETRTILIDCVNNPVLRLRRAGIDFEQLTDLILTHFHPDHVSGVPMLLMNMWLLGRQRPLSVYGLHHTLDRIEDLMGFYDWSHWPNFFPVSFCRLPKLEKMLVLESEELRIFAAPVRHLMPTLGLRIEFLKTNRVFAYSCDTEPCSQVIDLAAGADVLFHEATGATPGHSSASQAASIGRDAQAKSLYLIHYSTGDFDTQTLLDEARRVFPGPVALAEDFMMLEF